MITTHAKDGREAETIGHQARVSACAELDALGVFKAAAARYGNRGRLARIEDQERELYDALANVASLP